MKPTDAGVMCGTLPDQQHRDHNGDTVWLEDGTAQTPAEDSSEYDDEQQVQQSISMTPATARQTSGRRHAHGTQQEALKPGQHE